jgi:hypothetical protein
MDMNCGVDGQSVDTGQSVDIAGRADVAALVSDF